uniref:EF-hand domain-containing protein n=1 Tax=Nothobranchius furzeri TaxID=105023 RepID=A0A8C6VXT3_NOTFU
MTDLEKAMESLITVFHRYAKEGGNKNTLSKKELKNQISTEAYFLDKANEFFQMLDEDGDGTVSFHEYIIFCATLAMLC